MGGGASSNAAHRRYPVAPSILPKYGGAIATPAPPLLTPLDYCLLIIDLEKFLIQFVPVQCSVVRISICRSLCKMYVKMLFNNLDFLGKFVTFIFFKVHIF